MTDQISNFINENPIIFGGIIATVCIIILVLLIIANLKKRAKKKNMLRENENLVEIIFDSPLLKPHPMGAFAESANDGFTLYGVNGLPAETFGNSILVDAGEVSLDCNYSILPLGQHLSISYGRQNYTFHVSPSRKYIASFNLMEKCIELNEKV